MLPIFITAYTVIILVAMALSVSNIFLQVSAWVLAVLFGIALAQAIYRVKR